MQFVYFSGKVPDEFWPEVKAELRANYRHEWSRSMATSVGLFFELAEGNRFVNDGGNRYSFIYSGDVNGGGCSSEFVSCFNTG
ncbi:MAG: hypothetical protein IIA61_00285 [Candidatus Marinimicrobia bacterium]|nr:hypothetical protein [Candidatus Neomarinimicrobiota bacterium]